MLARPTRETQPCELNSTRLVGSDGAELGLVSDGAELGFVSDGAELGLVSDGAELGLVSDGAELGSWLTSQCSVVQCAVQCSAPCSAVHHAALSLHRVRPRRLLHHAETQPGGRQSQDLELEQCRALQPLRKDHLAVSVSCN